MIDMREDAQGVWWPARDVECSAVVPGQVADAAVGMRYVDDPGSSVCVQAGGNVGLWPLWYASRFERVLTFEPDAANWACLERNLRGHPLAGKITARNVALGEAEGSATLDRRETNCGAHMIADGHEFPVITLDGIGITERVGLIQLDVEGSEWQALKGGERLLRRDHPVLQLELKGIGRRYGYEDEECVAWLAGLGYREVERVHRDRVFA